MVIPFALITTIKSTAGICENGYPFALIPTD